MNNITRLQYILLTFTLLFSSASFGQSAEKLLGLPYNSPEITSLRGTFITENAKESFLPFLKVYQLDYEEDGISMEFNSNISLYRIALYDSGYTYKTYKGELPFKAIWGMSLEDLEKSTGVLEFDKTNIYEENLSCVLAIWLWA